MTVEERISTADRRRMDGNALFKEEKLEEAMQQYEMVKLNFSFINLNFLLLILKYSFCEYCSNVFCVKSFLGIIGHRIYG